MPKLRIFGILSKLCIEFPIKMVKLHCLFAVSCGNGSKNPQYDQEGMEVTVSKGPKMFGRATKEYKAKVEKGSLMDMAGYKLETRAIFDAQRIGMEYFRYQAFLKLANTDEFMTYEVTELEILDK